MLFIFKKSHNDIRYFRIFNDCILIIHELIARCCLFILKSHDDVRYLRIFYDCILIIHELIASCYYFFLNHMMILDI